MRVLVVTEPDRYGHVRGGHVQRERTLQQLETLGVGCREVVGWPDASAWAGCDIVHLFGIQEPTFNLRIARMARRAGLSIALSPIFWDFEERTEDGDFVGALEAGKRWAGVADVAGMGAARLGFHLARKARLSRLWAARRRLLAAADMWLPNSPGEGDLIRTVFHLRRPTVVVPNGVDAGVFSLAAMHDAAAVPFLKGTYALQVGIIDRCKNVRQTVLACDACRVPLVLVGDAPDPLYLRQCQQAGRSPVAWLGRLPPERLAGVYAGARVHVLPSFRETPGLASLEAAACGCNVVSTSIGSAEEYFGPMVAYCDPDNLQNVVSALARAWSMPWPNITLSRHVLERYTWHAAAAATAAAYRQLAGSGEAQQTVGG